MLYIKLSVFSASFINKVGFLDCIMVSGRHKSRSMRKVFRRTPSGKTVTAYKKRQPSKAKCAGCGKVLPGVARARPRKMQNMPKSAKRPERPFGGVLCSSCTRARILAKVRKK